MDFLIQFLSGYVQDENHLRLVFIALVAAAIFVLGLASTVLVLGLSDPLRRRLDALIGESPQAARRPGALGETLEPVAKYILPRQEHERARNRDRLVYAGYRSPDALTTFYAVKTLLGLGLPLVALMVEFTWFPTLTTTRMAFSTLRSPGSSA